MVMQMLRSGASGGLLKFFLFGLLGLSVGGLALMDVRGVLRGSHVSDKNVARIGNEVISLRSFDHTLRRSIARYRIQPDQAYKLGLVNEILSGQVRSYLLEQEAQNKGFDLSKKILALRIAQIIKPSVQPGQTMQQALKTLLQRQGMSEIEFASTIKREIIGEHLMQSIRSGYSFSNKDLLASELYKFQNQTRDVEAIFFADKDVQEIKPATQDELQELYEKIKDSDYKIPEYRTVKIAIFDPDKLNIKVEVTPEEIRKAYDNNHEKFTVGEQDILSQSLVDTLDQASAIYDKVQSGENLKDAVISVTGSDDKYFEKRNFEVASMIPEMAKAVENLKEGSVAKPIQTMLGFHIIRLDKRIAPKLLPFEEVKEEIKSELLKEKYDEEVYKISQDLDKSIDDGTSFKDLSKDKEYKLEIKTISQFDKKGLDKNGNDVLTPVANIDKKAVLELSYELEEGETSLLQELPSGMLAAFKLDSIEFETYKPFDEVKKDLTNRYVANQRHTKNFENVAKHLAELGTGGVTFDSLAQENNKGIMTYKSIRLFGKMPSPLTKDARPAIFQTKIGGYEIVDLDDQFAIIKVSGYYVPEISQDEKAQKPVKAISDEISRDMEDDTFLMYLRTLAEKRKPLINEHLLEKFYNKGQQ